MSVNTESTAAPTRRWSSKSRLAALTVAALAATGLTLGTATAAHAAANFSADTYVVQAGTFQTFFVEDFEDDGTVTVTLEFWDGSGWNYLNAIDYELDEDGNPEIAYTRIQIIDESDPSTPLPASTDYRLAADDGVNFLAFALEVIDWDGTATVTISNVTSTSITVEGSGWYRKDGNDNPDGNSVVGIKLWDVSNPPPGGTPETHTGALGDENPTPARSVVTGMGSTAQLWFYIGPGQDDPSSPFEPSILPNATYAALDGDLAPIAAGSDPQIKNGAFEVVVPLPTGVTAGTIQVLSGSMGNQPGNSGLGGTDQPRSYLRTF